MQAKAPLLLRIFCLDEELFWKPDVTHIDGTNATPNACTNWVTLLHQLRVVVASPPKHRAVSAQIRFPRKQTPTESSEVQDSLPLTKHPTVLGHTCPSSLHLQKNSQELVLPGSTGQDLNMLPTYSSAATGCILRREVLVDCLIGSLGMVQDT